MTEEGCDTGWPEADDDLRYYTKYEVYPGQSQNIPRTPFQSNNALDYRDDSYWVCKVSTLERHTTQSE
jgi:hypothetical protein